MARAEKGSFGALLWSEGSFMRVLVGVSAMLMLPGCQTIGDSQIGDRIAIGTSSKSVAQIVTCISFESEQAGYMVEEEHLPYGVAVHLSPKNSTSVFLVYSVENISDFRRVSLRVSNASAFKPTDLSRKVALCI